MSRKRSVEVFTAGCAICDEVVGLVKSLACPDCEVTVYSMHEKASQEKARVYNISSVPTMVIDGKLVDCCKRGKVDAESLRAAGLGSKHEKLS